MEAWVQNYSSACSGATINYTPSGSGAGVKQFIAGKVPFAGSDSALKDDEQGPADARCAGGKAVDLPMVISPIAVTYNLKGVDKLAVSPKALAGIFQGTITKWNDPAIAATNSGATLPATSIQVVFRSKDSGTTDNFTKFLEKAAGGDWKLGTGKAWKGKVGQGAPGSGDVAAAVKSTDGAISYIDAPDAKKNSLSMAALDLGSGAVEINDDSVGKAVAKAEKTVTGNDIKLSLDYGLTEAGAYPLVLVTYEITCTKGLPADQAALVKSFLTYTVSDEGQTAAADAGYSKLPAELQSQVKQSIDAIS
jgi:phosphate transport system substrate-binding protein